MVLHAVDRAALYRHLEALERGAAAEAAAPMHCHNFVNNADIVPRLLGSSLDAVHEAMESYIPSMKVWTLAATQLSRPCERSTERRKTRFLLSGWLGSDGLIAPRRGRG